MKIRISNEMLIELGVRAGVVLVILLFAFVLAKLVKKLMLKKERFLKIDKTQYKFIAHFISGMIYFFGIMLSLYSIPSMRGLAGSIFAGSGVLAIIFGFASRDAFSNIVSGLFIAMYKPFSLGDRIRLVGKDFYGTVEDITLRHTVIRTFENHRIIVPNSVISSETLDNFSIVDLKIVKFFEIGISYDSDVDKAMRIIKEEALKHPDFLDTRSDEQIREGEEPVKVRVIGYGDSSVNLRAYIWTTDPGAAFLLGCDLNYSVKARFDREGIEIPFPYRTLVFKEGNQNPKAEKK
jgi:small conductance mechanosensitive channel